jgi:hypothetical protein
MNRLHMARGCLVLMTALTVWAGVSVDGVPISIKPNAGSHVAPPEFTKQELDGVAYVSDGAHVTVSANAWVKKDQQDIGPKIRTTWEAMRR